MALKFNLRGTSLNAYYAAAYQQGNPIFTSGPSLGSSGASGIFGGAYIDFTGGGSLAFIGADNWAVNSKAFTLLIRLIPQWGAGLPSASQFMAFIGPGNNAGEPLDGLKLFYYNYGDMAIDIKDKNDTAIYNDQFYGTQPTFAQGVPSDLWVAWDGTSDAIELWQGLNGQIPTKIATANPYTVATANRAVALANGMTFGANAFSDSAASQYWINEIAIWDTYVAPTTFGARTGFIPCSNVQGYSYSDPGASNVASGVQYTYQGVQETGTLEAVTNVLKAATISSGQNTQATLIAGDAP